MNNNSRFAGEEYEVNEKATKKGVRSIEYDTFFGEYFNALRNTIQYSKISLAADTQSKLVDIYVPMPIDKRIDINVINKEVIKISYSGQIDSTNKVKESFESCKKTLNRMVKRGVDYHYQNNDRPLIMSPTWADGIKRNFWILNSIDFISLNKISVLLGEPGYGKSTAVRYLSLKLIEQLDKNTTVLNDISISSELFENKFRPIYLELKDFISWTVERDLNTIEIKDIISYIMHVYLDIITDTNENWADLLSNNCLFILDGLDEINCSDDNRKKVLDILNLVEQSGTNKAVITCRERDYSEWKFSRMKVANILEMDDVARLQLIDNIFNEYRLDLSSLELISIFERLNIDEKIYSSPLLLTLIIKLYIKDMNDIPSKKSTILQESIELLLRRKCNNIQEVLNGEIELVISALSEIAYEIQTQSKDNQAKKINGRLMKGVISEYLDNSLPKTVVKFFKATAGVIAAVGKKEFEFTHKTFQEYLCANYLINSLGINNAIDEIREGYLEEPYSWRETTLLFIDLMIDSNKQDQLWIMVYKLIKYCRNNGYDEEPNAAWLIWYCAKVIQSNEYGLLPENDMDFDDRNEYTLELLKSELLNVFVSDNLLTLRHRVECGVILGVLGDPREGVGINEEGMPDFYWCLTEFDRIRVNNEIEFGINDYSKNIVRKDQYEGSYWGKGSAFNREENPKYVVIKDIGISKYPVTVMQFMAFIEADDGYNNSEWWSWSSASFEWYKKNRKLELGKIHDSKYPYVDLEKNRYGKCNVPNFPVTNVSWFEAIAFCKWLSVKSDSFVRLPTEAEWEAASKQSADIFSWGNSFDARYCNSSYSKIGDIIPVGFYEKSMNSIIDNKLDMPMDMNGNVWEWCQSVYPAWCDFDETIDNYDDMLNYINIDNNDVISNNTKISVRGGSFINAPNLLRNTFRGRDQACMSFYRQGFRVALDFDEERKKIVNLECACAEESEIDYQKKGDGSDLEFGDLIKIGYGVYDDNNNVIEERITPGEAIDVILGNGNIHSCIEEFIVSSKTKVTGSFNHDFQVYVGSAEDKPVIKNFYIIIHER